ncbi:hypothetical protein F5Y16DRAFT_153215 [Xylariaceae sp. FL0255]|nr:hypothetical protein F5Y16DRAFT_153215 [Xylariaceae sp. FL0255]
MIASQPPPAKDNPIAIVGCGVFGLSTTLHLTRRGYSDFTVMDKHAYDDTRYPYFNGIEAASADMNKIVRSAYDKQTEYQSLSREAIAAWHSGNVELGQNSTHIL